MWEGVLRHLRSVRMAVANHTCTTLPPILARAPNLCRASLQLAGVGTAGALRCTPALPVLSACAHAPRPPSVMLYVDSMHIKIDIYASFFVFNVTHTKFVPKKQFKQILFASQTHLKIY